MDNNAVQAYAKLEGESFCYYIRTLQVILGRKASSSDSVDIHLGPTKAISRHHARLFYNFSTQRFEMVVYGKNGAFVNEQFVEKGSTVTLENRTKIQIGEVQFSFLLPRMDSETNSVENEADTSNKLLSVEYADKNRLFEQSRSDVTKELKLSNGIEKKEITQMETVEKTDRESIRLASQVQESSQTTRINPLDSKMGGESIDTTEFQSRETKPPFSYASLIAQAINSAPSKRLTLNGIYHYITAHYPFYQLAQNGWQNSIRHNLSLNKAFVKVPRNDSEPGKGAFWTIDPEAEAQFSNGVYKRNRKTTAKIMRPASSSYVSSADKPTRKRYNKGNDPLERGGVTNSIKDQGISATAIHESNTGTIGTAKISAPFQKTQAGKINKLTAQGTTLARTMQSPNESATIKTPGQDISPLFSPAAYNIQVNSVQNDGRDQSPGGLLTDRLTSEQPRQHSSSVVNQSQTLNFSIFNRTKLQNNVSLTHIVNSEKLSNSNLNISAFSDTSIISETKIKSEESAFPL